MKLCPKCHQSKEDEEAWLCETCHKKEVEKLKEKENIPIGGMDDGTNTITSSGIRHQLESDGTGKWWKQRSDDRKRIMRKGEIYGG